VPPFYGRFYHLTGLQPVQEAITGTLIRSNEDSHGEHDALNAMKNKESKGTWSSVLMSTSGSG